jgi:hypothetical protein
MDWFEDLPQYCPPPDATPSIGTYYRIAEGDPTTSSDFFSQRKLQPNKVFKGQGVDECIARAVSLFQNIDDAKKRQKLPKFRPSVIACVTLEPKDGMIKKTFRDSHYSWWRSKLFNVEQAKVVDR